MMQTIPWHPTELGSGRAGWDGAGASGKRMMFRRKLLAVFALTVFLSVAAVALLVSAVARRAFERSEDERTAALVTQFRREFSRQGEDVGRRVGVIAASEDVGRMAVKLSRPQADAGPYFELAKTAAESSRLDFLEFVESDGTIISSAQWPAKFGYPDSGVGGFAASADQGAFLKQEDLQDGTALGLFAVRTTRSGERLVFVIGGRRLDKNFLSGIDMPAGMRALLYQNRGERFAAELVVDPSEPATVRPAEKLEPLVDEVRQSKQEMSGLVHWSGDKAEDEVFHAIPLLRAAAGKDGQLLAILLIGNSRRPYVELMRHIRSAALMVGGGGILLAILLSSWAAARVTRPVEQLAHAAQEVAAGNWNARVDVLGDDELGQLADSFNRMTAELLGQQERLVQAERVAAWRELARRLAHELKNPLFPLQLTVENLMKARDLPPAQFAEIFSESTATLMAEITNLKNIIARFSDFSKMPKPQLQDVDVAEMLRKIAALYEPALAQHQPPIATNCNLQMEPLRVSADPDLLHRALSNLVLNAMDAMPNGGTLTIAARPKDGAIEIRISDTGTGMSAEECERLFTPYYTTKQHGTGLGLAIVQSVVIDHHGTIRVDSIPGSGSTFVVELPVDQQNARTSEAAAKAVST